MVSAAEFDVSTIATVAAPAPAAPQSPRAEAPAVAEEAALAPSPLSRTRASAKKHRIKIGAKHSCSCGGVDEKAGELCHHVLFVMLKVLRVPEGNALGWQLSLVDSELEMVLSFRQTFEDRAREMARKHEYLRRRQGGGAGPRHAASAFVTDGDGGDGDLERMEEDALLSLIHI